MGMRQLLLHPVITGRKVSRGCDDQRMWRRAQSCVRTIDLPPRRAAANQAEVANPFIGPNAFENERGTGVEAVRCAFVVGRSIKPLRCHAGSRDRLRRSAHASTHPAQFAGKAMIILPALGEPGSNAVLATTHLDHPWQRLMIGRAPVEAISSEVDKAAALVLERREGIEHAQ